MPFQYVTFDDGQPLSARQIQKISSNQFELSETYNERSRGLVYNKVIPKELGSISVTAAGDAVKLISFDATVYPDRYYLLDGQVGRIQNAGALSLSGTLQLYLSINGVYISLVNEVNDTSTTTASSGFYINHIWQSPSTIPSGGKQTYFGLFADDGGGDAANYNINFNDNTYQGRVRLSLIDLGAVNKAGYYG